MSPRARPAAPSPRKKAAAAPRPAIAPHKQDPEAGDADSLEFLKAIDAYKRRTGKGFPTWTEVLQIVKSLGYRKV